LKYDSISVLEMKVANNMTRQFSTKAPLHATWYSVRQGVTNE
jgi:hypothetical protein